MFGRKALKDELPLSYTTRRENQWFKHIWFANWYKCHFSTFPPVAICVFSWKKLMISLSLIDASCRYSSLVLPLINKLCIYIYRTFQMFFSVLACWMWLTRNENMDRLPSLKYRDKKKKKNASWHLVQKLDCWKQRPDLAMTNPHIIPCLTVCKNQYEQAVNVESYLLLSNM